MAFRNLTSATLKRLMEDEAAYKEFLHDQDQVKQASKVRDDLKYGNVELARKNLARESETNELRTQCRIIRGTESAAAQERLESLRKREQELLDKCSVNSLLDKLKSEVHKVDAECEEIHTKFVDGEMKVGEFLPQYRKFRKVYNTRKLLLLAALDMAGMSSQGWVL